MDVESLLHESLDVRQVPIEAAAGFETRVMRSLPNRSRRRVDWRSALVGLAAALAIAAMAVPSYLGSGPRSGPAGLSPSPSSTTTATASAKATPAPTPSPVQTIETTAWGLRFARPLAWEVTDVPAPVPPAELGGPAPSYVREVLGYVGTGRPQTVCTVLDTGGRSVGRCSSNWSLAPGDVVVRFQRGDIGAQNVLWGPPGDGVTVTTVGGLPGWFMRNQGSGVPELPAPNGTGVINESVTSDTGVVLDDATILEWELPGALPASPGATAAKPVRIVAAIRGPNAVALEAQVRALVESIEYVPAVVRLPTDSASLATLSSSALTATLDKMDAAEAGTAACFPRQPGSKSSSITLTPNDAKLGKPLPVTCSVAIEPNAMQGWTVSLTATWAAADDRKAGTWILVDYVTTDGDSFGIGANTTHEFPYEVGSGRPG